MAKFFATQTVTITYGKYIEADSRGEALNMACEVSGNLDDWKEVDCESGDSVYIAECYKEVA
jgi:formylmethanofuran dehydrogenase subunit D